MENNHIEQMIGNVIRVGIAIQFELYAFLRNSIYPLEGKLGGYILLK